MEHIHTMERVLLTPDSTPLHHAYTVSFVNQITQWAAYAKPVIPVDVSRALVAIFIGINDISDSAKYTFPRNNVTNFPSFYAEIIGTELEAIETIYEAGYRNYLSLNLPPLERTVCLFPSNPQYSILIPTARQRRTGRYTPSK
jgi:lysophospholipase L1-like esterase